MEDFRKARKLDDHGVLLPYQRNWIEDQAQVKVIEKSRRIGVSWAEAGADALFAASTAGGDVWYIGYNKDMALEFIADAAFWGRLYHEAAGEMEEVVIEDEGKDVLSYRITFASGHRITALSSRPTNLRGKQGRLVIDEAAFHDDLAGLIKAGLAFLVWGGSVRIISTHNGEANEFNALVQDVRAGRKPYSLHRVDFDQALADGLCRRIFEILGRKWSPQAEGAWRREIIDFYGEDAGEELFCVPGQGSGVFLPRALIETCLSRDIPVIRYEQPSSFAAQKEGFRQSEVRAWCEQTLDSLLAGLDSRRRSYFGEDFGRSGDLSVVVPLIERQSAAFAAPFVLELRNIPFKQQEQILFHVVDRLPRFTFGALDARGNGQYLAEVAMQRFGPQRIEGVMLSENWYRENMPRYKAAFEDRRLALPLDADIIEDHRTFRMVRGVARIAETRTRGRDKKQRHGDTAVAGALAWYAACQDRGGLPRVLSRGAPNMAADLEAF